ncbi:MAG: Rrf2 family transcriptional regulator [Dehalococcoidia bacterium]|nr:Rrf2 family transcriptional regulator [Dehalococcoidia bacterium]
MKLSTRSRYGMRALLDVARQSNREPVRLKEIARRQEVSLSYLEHIVGPLIAGGILRSTRGPGGGVSLIRRPEDIRLAEVMHLLEGPLNAADCVWHPDVCPRSSLCATRALWRELSSAIEGVLRDRTLADLMNQDDAEMRGSCAPDAVRPMASASPAPGGASIAQGRSTP